MFIKTGAELWDPGLYSPSHGTSSANYDIQMVRLTIRATDESVPPVLIKLMEERLAVGISTQPEMQLPPSRREISDAFGNILVE